MPTVFHRREISARIPILSRVLGILENCLLNLPAISSSQSVPVRVKMNDSRRVNENDPSSGQGNYDSYYRRG